MRVAVGSDHAGLALKSKIVSMLETLGYETIDVGTYTDESVDYPVYALKVCHAIVRGESDRGILVCKTGAGMSMVANKVPGIRACQIFNCEMAVLSREHNDSNVLALGDQVIDHGIAMEAIQLWLTTEYAGGRHERRLSMMREIERSPSHDPAHA